MRIVGSLVSDGSRSTLDDAFQKQLPEIDWGRIIGMRHKLVHDYFLIDYDVVWEAATMHVPQLLTALENLHLAEPEP